MPSRLVIATDVEYDSISPYAFASRMIMDPITVPGTDSESSVDSALQGLQMQARLHAAGDDDAVWRATLNTWVDWLSCSGPIAVTLQAGGGAL